MSASLVYLLVREVLQMLTQLARDGEPLVSVLRDPGDAAALAP